MNKASQNTKKPRLHSNSIALLLLLFVALAIGACANRLGPGGGPYDDTPPRLLRSSPADGARNVKKMKKLVLEFDEYVSVKDASKKVIVSPPQQVPPRIQAVGKKVTLVLEDTLIDNTTYSFDFTDAIVDNNEENALENFSMAISTGPDLDTMQLAGVVLDARNLEPVQDVLVGVHPDSSLAMFRDTIFLRMSRTSDRARFVIRNMKEGAYRIYALKDNDANYRYNNPLEGIAFSDSLYTTDKRPATRIDSVFSLVKGKRVLDSLDTVSYTEYLPNDIVLRYFVSDKVRNYLNKRERPDSDRIVLEFNAMVFEPEAMPQLVPYGQAFSDSSDLVIPDALLPSNKITYYLRTAAVQKKDSFVVRYASVDSLQKPIFVQDTLSLKYDYEAKAKELAEQEKKDMERKKKEAAKKAEAAPNDSIPPQEKPEKKPEKVLWSLKGENKGEGGVHDSIFVRSTAPLRLQDLREVLKLYLIKDSTEQVVQIDTITALPGSHTSFLLKAPLRYKTNYVLRSDTTKLLKDLFGRDLREAFEFKWSVKDKGEFSTLQLELQNVDGEALVGELLSEQDQVIRRAFATKEENILLFDELKPQTYYFRLVVDKNANGRWDTGDLDEGLQPEPVYYMPKAFELLKNWTVKESFDPFAIPLQEQKPEKLIKNKPKEKKKRDRNKEREEEMRSRNGGGGMGNFGSGGLGGLRRGF